MKNKNISIHFIITGGTIDSYYDGTKDTAVPNKSSIIPRYIQSINLNNKTFFTEVCMKDSRALTGKDLKMILHKVEKSTSKYIIITHGTYTMPDTARYLNANLKRKDQVIILTAAMLPMTEFTMSDGGFNLGFAVAQLQTLNNGVYVGMNGTIYHASEVIKIISEGRFSSIIEQ